MLSPATPETPPMGFERKFTSSIRRLRASSMNCENASSRASSQRYRYSPTPTGKVKSSLGLHRLRSINRQDDKELNREEAMWFLALPEKVRRQYFTREEQILLRAACEIALADHPLFDGMFGDQRPWTDGRGPSINSYGGRGSHSSRNFVLDHQYSPLEVKPFSVKEHQSHQTHFSSPRPRTHSFASTSPRSLQRSSGRARASSIAPSRLDEIDSTARKSEISSSAAKHYLDPRIKNKIRQYLATSQGFDEMIAYGFPTDEESTTDARNMSTSPSTHQLEEDLESVDEPPLACSSTTHSEDDDTTSDTDEEPMTPGSVTTSEWDFHHHYTPVKRESSSSVFRTPDREMTLRVTLTRPDLRSADDEACAWQVVKSPQTAPEKTDPLALERLSFSEDVTGMHGAFAVTGENSKGLKKLWKRLQRNSPS